MKRIFRSVAVLAVFAPLGLGQVPEGWQLGGGGVANHYEVSLDKQVKRTGQASARLESKTDQPGIPFGNVLQIISADAYRGKRVRLAAYLQTAANERGAWMWLRADSPTKWRLDNMRDRPIKNASVWRRAEIVMDIPNDAQTLSVGFALFGGGKLWVDDMSLEVVAKTVRLTTTLKEGGIPDGEKNSSASSSEPMPKALTNKGFEN